MQCCLPESTDVQTEMADLREISIASIHLNMMLVLTSNDGDLNNMVSYFTANNFSINVQLMCRNIISRYHSG